MNHGFFFSFFSPLLKEDNSSGKYWGCCSSLWLAWRYFYSESNINLHVFIAMLSLFLECNICSPCVAFSSTVHLVMHVVWSMSNYNWKQILWMAHQKHAIRILRLNIFLEEMPFCYYFHTTWQEIVADIWTVVEKKCSIVFMHLLEFFIYAVNILFWKVRYADTGMWYAVKIPIVLKKVEWIGW